MSADEGAADERLQQNPHFNPELDPESNGSDEGASDMARLTGIESLIVGAFLVAAGLLLEATWALLAGGALTLFGGVSLFILSRRERNRRLQ
ncbi:MAG: hypothetical protein AAFX08_04690 [Pseudomonadota bacterium]